MFIFNAIMNGSGRKKINKKRPAMINAVADKIKSKLMLEHR